MTCIVGKAEKPSFHTDSKTPDWAPADHVGAKAPPPPCQLHRAKFLKLGHYPIFTSEFSHPRMVAHPVDYIVKPLARR